MSGKRDHDDAAGAEPAPLTAAAELAGLAANASLLVVGGQAPGGRDCDRLPADATVADLDGLGGYDLGVVRELAAADESLLGRLRDLHTRRLVVTGAAAGLFDPRRMLALGFEHHPSPEAPRGAYLYDRDSYNRPREWNSPENWANPENFDKYRW
ncbi:MAG TPA: DUF6231 family protein [Woeseiaceae bacterium]|nr:DUF6231 family protein [Woeseiaceae bacterium]